MIEIKREKSHEKQRSAGNMDCSHSKNSIDEITNSWLGDRQGAKLSKIKDEMGLLAEMQIKPETGLSKETQKQNRELEPSKIANEKFQNRKMEPCRKNIQKLFKIYPIKKILDKLGIFGFLQQ